LSIKNKIRLGREGDGGYVVYSKLLDKTEVLITYGVGWEISFEEHFNQLTNRSVLMFDPTMFGDYLIDWNEILKFTLRLRFVQVFIHLRRALFLWRKKKELRKKGILFISEGISAKKTDEDKYDTLLGHLERFGQTGKQLLLKMDIEGVEYEVFNNDATYDCLINVNQLLIEFHDLKNRLRNVQHILARLSRDFEIVHIHANNAGHTFLFYDLTSEGNVDIALPDILEISFVRRELICSEDILTLPEQYPVSGLDFPNDPFKKDLKIGFL
jgi:hypothetical protein